jgi:hypothetical protein
MTIEEMLEAKRLIDDMTRTNDPVVAQFRANRETCEAIVGTMPKFHPKPEWAGFGFRGIPLVPDESLPSGQVRQDFRCRHCQEIGLELAKDGHELQWGCPSCKRWHHISYGGSGV